MVALESDAPIVDAPAEVVENQEPELTKEQKEIAVKEFFTEGKKGYLAASYDLAAEKLSEAVRLGVELNGEFAAENYQYYYFYGKSLLEIGRAEDDVLKTALKDMPLPEENPNDSIDEEQYGNPESLSAEEREEIKEQVDEALAENARDLDEKQTSSEGTADDNAEAKTEDADAKAEEKTEDADAKAEEKTGDAEAKTDEKTEETEEKADEKTEETEANADEKSEEVEAKSDEKIEESADAEENAEEAEQMEVGDGEGEGDNEDDEPASSIQAAWEILEVARKICDSQEPSKDWELNKADVLLALGECSIEDENYTQAVDDITVAVELYQKHLTSSNRTLARTFVMMARAYKLNDDFGGAADYYSKAKESLTAKIAELEAESAESEEKKAENAKEIEELNGVVSDIDLKIEDAKESAQQTDENIAKIKEQLGLKTANTLTEKTDAPANDITNMVRKGVKRAADASQTDESKRLKEINAE